MKTAQLKVIYNNEDISEDISKYLIDFTFNDNLTDRADDISITLDNTTGVWINEWYPTMGSTLDISLLLDYDDVKKEVRFGKFNIDELDTSFKPDILTIKAITSLVEGKFKDELATGKVRTNIAIKQLVTEIAKKHGFEVEYKAKINYTIRWVQQKDQSDANFLYKELSKYGLIFKVNDKRLIVYEDIASDRLVEIKKYSNLSFRCKTHGVYSSVKLTYRNPKKAGKSIDYIFTDKSIKTGKTLLLQNKNAESIAEAELIAKAELRRKNARATTGSLTMLGVGEIYSGQKIAIKNVGMFSSEYKVEKVVHNLSRGNYTNSVEFISL